MKLFHLLDSEFGLQDLRKQRLKIARLDDLNDPFELVAADQSEKPRRKVWYSIHVVL